MIIELLTGHQYYTICMAYNIIYIEVTLLSQGNNECSKMDPHSLHISYHCSIRGQPCEFLSLKGGCTGSSETTLVKMPHSWKSHVRAQFQILALIQN